MNDITQNTIRNTYEIHIDGSCIGNPGPGGYGIYAVCNGEAIQRQGGEPDTTNNRMELMAAIIALKTLDQPSDVRIVTDSQYVQKGMTAWIYNWKRNGWRNAKRKPVENVDLWTRLEAAARRHRVEWIWVRGHDGNPGNERAHQLAEEAAREQYAIRSSGGRYAS